MSKKVVGFVELSLKHIITSGETEGNLKCIIDSGGKLSLPLTSVGQRQAAAAGNALKEVHFHVRIENE